MDASEGEVCQDTAQPPRFYAVLSAREREDGRRMALVVPLAASDHPSPFAVPCRFAGQDRRAVLDEMIEVDIDRLTPAIGSLDLEDLTTIKRGLRELYAD